MIDLTPLEVRKKKGDFRRAMRGYDSALVDDFLDLVADRLEELVRDNIALQEKAARQEEQVRDYRDRERALTEALVSAQEMREDVRRQSAREAELATRSAQQEAEQLRARAEEEVRLLRSGAQQEASQALSSIQQERQRLEEGVLHLRARQQEFLSSYRSFLEQELAELGVIARAAGLTERAANARQARPAQAPAAAPKADPAAAAERETRAPARSDAAGPAALAASPPSADIGQAAAVPPAEQTGAATAPVEGATDPRLDVPEATGQDDVGEESAFALDTAADGVDLDEEPFAPEPFVDDESIIVAEAFEAEAAVASDRAVPGLTDETDVSGHGAEVHLYDGIAADEDGDGVPGPIGLGEAEPWSAAPDWSMPDLQLVGDGFDGEDIELDDEDDEDMQALLRNAAAAGYHLDDDPVTDELLLDEAVADDGEGPDAPTNDGWLPTLLEDDK